MPSRRPRHACDRPTRRPISTARGLQDPWNEPTGGLAEDLDNAWLLTPLELESRLAQLRQSGITEAILHYTAWGTYFDKYTQAEMEDVRSVLSLDADDLERTHRGDAEPSE